MRLQVLQMQSMHHQNRNCCDDGDGGVVVLNTHVQQPAPNCDAQHVSLNDVKHDVLTACCYDVLYSQYAQNDYCWALVNDSMQVLRLRRWI